MLPLPQQHEAEVESVRRMARSTWCVRLSQPDLARRILPGQFFMIRLTDGTDPLLGRPFALYDTFLDTAGNPAGVEFGFVVVGKLTALMADWRAGTRVRVWGPLGNGFPVPTAERLLCVAGGIGQTPFLAVAQEALGRRSYGEPGQRRCRQRPDSVSLLYGVRSRDYAAGLDDFDLAGLTVRLATDDGSAGHHGLVTDLLIEELNRSTDSTQVYCCGPEPMMKAVSDRCQDAGVPCWVSLETPMACGFGACFSCVAKVRTGGDTWDYRRTCVEGPVFPADRIIL